MKEGYKSAISLDDMLLKVKLGLTDREKDIPQDIKISFKLFFPDAPKACESDNINDTICYYEIFKAIKEHCAQNSYRLLEYLCHQLYKEIRKMADSSIKIWIKIEKCNPPIEGFDGVTAFEYEG